MTSNVLFIRKAELIIGPKVPFTNGPVEPVDAISIKTRLKFNVVQDESGNANKAKISIYNLSEDTKTFLEKKDLVVFLNAGYESNLSSLFFGDLQRFDEKRSGPDITTTIECGDGEKSLTEANIQLGFGPGATNKQVIDAAIKKLNMPKGFMADIPVIKYHSAFSYAGSVKNLMNNQMALVDLDWSIQNGEFQVLGKAQTGGQIAVELSPETGLIGTPTKTKDGVEFISLLNPEIRPGRAVVLNSKRFLDGSGATVKVIKTTFDGDTHDGQWQVKCEALIQ